MRQSTELTKIIAAVRKAVDHEEEVLGYKVKFKTSEVKEALEDLGYVLNFKEGSRKKKMFYHLTEGDKPTWVPADEEIMLSGVGGYIISRREGENYLANPIKSAEFSTRSTTGSVFRRNAQKPVVSRGLFLFKKADEKKVVGELEKKVDDAVQPKDETTEVIPAPKGRRTWAYWSIGLLTAVAALGLYLNSRGTAERKGQEYHSAPSITEAEYSALQEDCNQLGADLSQCTESLNAAKYDPRGQTTSNIVNNVKSYIDGTKEDLYLGPGCENAANELYARLHGVKSGEATFRRALESSWDVCTELVLNPTKVIHYKK